MCKTFPTRRENLSYASENLIYSDTRMHNAPIGIRPDKDFSLAKNYHC